MDEEQTAITDPSFTAADLSRAEREVERARHRLADAVDAARIEGWSWDRIGAVVGTTGETVRRRHLHPVARQRRRRF